jgi:O-methyltransferase involved in polyketide biosynthesis
VLEGILPYLSAAEVRGLLHAIRNSFSRPTLVCDLTTLAFARRYASKIGKRLRELGAPYGRLEVEPLGLIEGAGFRLTTSRSAVGESVALGMLWIPRWLLATALRSLRDGYTVASFEPAPG